MQVSDYVPQKRILVDLNSSQFLLISEVCFQPSTFIRDIIPSNNLHLNLQIFYLFGLQLLLASQAFRGGDLPGIPVNF